MARMIRKQICIEPRLDELLARTARERGVSQGEVVRAALQTYLEGADEVGDAAWAYFMGQARERAAHAVDAGERTWRREDLYEERLVRGHERDRLRARLKPGD